MCFCASSNYRADSSARMMRLINLLQSFFDHVRVNLRGGYIGMAKHHLHRAEIGAAVEQVSRKAVPQHVRRQRFAQPGLSAVQRQILPERNAVQLVSFTDDKKIL